LLGNPKLARIRVQFLGSKGEELLTTEIGFDQLALAPLDVLSMPEAQGIPQELNARVQRAVVHASPTGTTRIVVLTDRDPAWKPEVIGIAEWLTLVQRVARLVNSARPLAGKDLVIQGDAPAALDIHELQSRADASEKQMQAALTSLQTHGASAASLLAAAAFGITGGVPSTDASEWPSQIALATAELTTRASQLNQLAAGFTRATATPEQSAEHDSSRLKLVFGGSFAALPVLSPTGGDMWANSLALQANDPLEAVRWFQRAARVRPGAARLDTALMVAEALSGQLLMQFKVAQLPAAANDKWIVLPGATSSSRLSLVAFTPTAVTVGASFAGMIIDEWTEVLPSPQQITGVSFQYPDPMSRPPQSILLAVKPDDFPEWTLEAVEGSVLEALDLAKIRAVDPDSLNALGHYLPALYFAFNTGAPKVETVSIDFNHVLKANLTKDS
jgi:hypothetical protein